LTLQTPAGLELRQDGFGNDVVFLPGLANVGPPGSPALPQVVYNIALPPDADWAGLEVRVLGVQVEELAGRFDLAQAPPAATWEGGQRVLNWVGASGPIMDGRDRSIYGQEGFYPPDYVTVVGTAQMRKWRYLRILFSPVQYHPASGRLRVARTVDVELAFRRDPALLDEALLQDRVMDGVARRTLLNYEQARAWYTPQEAPPISQETYDYVIVTTNAIEQASTVLPAYLAHKQNQGFHPLVITEDEYGSMQGPPPNGTAEKIRQWLIEHFFLYGIEYVLLVGNPDPAYNDVPMKMCWPRFHETELRESPTDYYYADLTGNWDLDGDQFYGEYEGDQGPGGVDFANEVYVGRIPVYTGGTVYLDDILQKTIDYETEADDISWRKAALLPLSFSDSSTDGAYLAEYMKSTYLYANGYEAHTLYQHKTTGCNSTYLSDEDLVDNAVRAHWVDNAYGLVTWWGHGNTIGAYIGYGDTCSDGAILETPDAYYLDDDHPAFTYQCSCGNGTPESPNNLGYVLLKRGAIGTVSATRVSWYAVTSWNPGLKYYADNASIGYFYDALLVAEEPAGQALFHVKADMGLNLNHAWDGVSWMNLMSFNLYGAPDTSLATACQGVEAIEIEGPAQLKVGQSGLFTATVLPPTATLPLTLTWDNGAVGPTAAYSWTQPGDYTITVRATNRCGAVSVIHDVSVCQPVTDVAITGPAQLVVGETGLYTASPLPPTATGHVKLAWDNSTMGPTAAYSWTQPGHHTLAVTAINDCGHVSTTFSVDVCQPLVEVSIAGPGDLVVGEPGLYTATAFPLTATWPLTVTWDNGQVGTCAVYSWTRPGTHSVAVTTVNRCSAVGAVQEVVVCQPVAAVAIAGPADLRLGEVGLYTASVSPPTATRPLTLTWDNGTVGAAAAYSWTVSGWYTLTLQAANGCGVVLQSFEVQVHPWRIFLPVVRRE
jgi:hypothetical protein